MRTILTLDKLGLDGRHYHHERLSRSFLKSMVTFLYMQAAQSNVALSDENGGYRTVYLAGPNLHVAPLPAYDGSYDTYGGAHPEAFGIRVGSSDIAVTPTDYFILNSLIPHTLNAPEGASEVRIAYDDLWAYSSYKAVYGSNWSGQTLHVPYATSVTGCKFRFTRRGTVVGKTLTISLRRTYGDITNVINSDLAVGTLALDDTITTDQWGQMLEVTFGTPYAIQPNYQYALCCRTDCANSSNCIAIPYPSSYSGYKYPDHVGQDNRIDSTDGGVNWTTDLTYRYSYGYQLLGKTPLGLAYSGTIVGPVTISGSTAQFIMEALFSNYSGSSITVKEITLNCFGQDYSYGSGNKRGLTYLIARDVLGSPVSVLNGEILRVRYIPQITV
jgi:hypothetical protein